MKHVIGIVLGSLLFLGLLQAQDATTNTPTIVAVPMSNDPKELQQQVLQLTQQVASLKQQNDSLQHTLQQQMQNQGTQAQWQAHQLQVQADQAAKQTQQEADQKVRQDQADADRKAQRAKMDQLEYLSHIGTEDMHLPWPAPTDTNIGRIQRHHRSLRCR